MKATLLQSLKDLAYAVSEKMQCLSFDEWNSPYVCLVRFLYTNVHASHNILCRVLRASSFLQFRNEAYNHYVARFMAGSGGWTFIIARAHTQTVRASIIKRITLLFNRSKGFLKRWDASGQFPQCAAPFQNRADSPKVCNTPNTNCSDGIVK